MGERGEVDGGREVGKCAENQAYVISTHSYDSHSKAIKYRSTCIRQRRYKGERQERGERRGEREERRERRETEREERRGGRDRRDR